MGRTVSVLSIDGGGIRGIIPAMVLAEIEERAQAPIYELFDLIAGTSTGGILALGLTKPDCHGKPAYSADELVDLYKNEGANIFSRSLWRRVMTLGNLLEEKYPSEGLDDVLASYFGDVRLRDALTDVLITSYDIEGRTVFLFKSRRATDRTDYDFPMQLVARATSAAPTYFEPARINVTGPPPYYALIDGGVFANNPGMCAYVEARDIFADADDVLIVSLGTGVLTRRIPYEEAKGWGLARWTQPILDVVFDGVSDTVDYQLAQLCKNKDGMRYYYRFQVNLREKGSDSLDDASGTNLSVLQQLAEEMIRNKDKDLSVVVAQLKEVATARKATGREADTERARGDVSRI